MNIALVSIAFNGYGRFAGQFLAFASAMKPAPSEVIILLGKDHGCQDIELLQGIYPSVKIVKYNRTPNFGKLRNIAISKTSSEWIQFVSIDDKVQPDAIKTFKKALKDEPNADYICAEWYTIGLGRPLEKHKSPTPKMSYDRLINKKKMGFIIAHSPFKRNLWEQKNFINSDLPNYTFVRDCIRNGAIFTQANKPTTTYLRRHDSHARAVLPGKMRTRARKFKKDMEKSIIEYYKPVDK